MFDSDGGFGEGTWELDGEHWTIAMASTLPDGKKASSVNLMKMIDSDSYTWQSVARAVDGEILPNTDEVLIVRKKG